MNIAAVLLGLLVATLIGAVFHLWKGGSLGRLLLYLLLGWAGFLTGHVLGGVLAWDFASLGGIRFGMGVLVAVAAEFVGHWLSLIQSDEVR